MAFSSEVTGKLGIDTSSIPGDLAKAKGAFNQFGQSVEKSAGEHGANAGQKLVGSLEHKIFGARHLSGALATALGLNIEKIAEHIAEAIEGGSKEGWKEAVDIADRQTKVIEEMIETRMSPSRVLAKHRRDLDKAVEESTGVGINDEGKATAFEARYGTLATKIATLFGVLKSDAEILKDREEAGLNVSEKHLTVLKDQERQKELNAKFSKQLNDVEAERLLGADTLAAAEQKLAYIKKEIVEMDSDDPKLGDAIIERKKQELHIQELIKKQKEDSIQKERELAKLGVASWEAQRKLLRDKEELENKIGDRSKLTLGELSNLRADSVEDPKRQESQFGENYGLSDEARKAKELARDIEFLEKKANQLRLTGNGTEAAGLFEQVSAKRDELVKTGFVKSTEGDEFRQLKETIHKDNLEVYKIWTEISTTLQGKYVNQ